MQPALKSDRPPLELPLPRAIWRRIIRAVNSHENVTLKIRFARGKVVAALTEEEMHIDD